MLAQSAAEIRKTRGLRPTQTLRDPVSTTRESDKGYSQCSPQCFKDFIF